jgi:hypothetical protein
MIAFWADTKTVWPGSLRAAHPAWSTPLTSAPTLPSPSTTTAITSFSSHYFFPFFLYSKSKD